MGTGIAILPRREVRIQVETGRSYAGSPVSRSARLWLPTWCNSLNVIHYGWMYRLPWFPGFRRVMPREVTSCLSLYDQVMLHTNQVCIDIDSHVEHVF